MKKLVLLAAVLLTSAASAAAQKLSPLGRWQTAEKATVEVYACGDKVCAKLVQLPSGRATATDSKNPDATLRERPLQGLVIMQNLVLTEENKWDDGTIYDPASGRTYSCYLRLVDNNTAEMKGYIGTPMLGRTTTWTRLK